MSTQVRLSGTAYPGGNTHFYPRLLYLGGLCICTVLDKSIRRLVRGAAGVRKLIISS